MPNNTALITGSAKRVGRDIALNLARHGWKIVIHYNTSIEDAKTLFYEVKQLTDAYIICADFNKLIADDTQLESFFAEISNNFYQPSLLVNNAAMFCRDEIDLPFNINLYKHMNVNCIAPLMLSHAFFRQSRNLIEKGLDLNIINIGDTLNFNGPFFSYKLSKQSLILSTESLAQLLSPIRVNTINPSFVMKSSRQSEAEFQKMLCKNNYIPTSLDSLNSQILKILNTNSMNSASINL